MKRIFNIVIFLAMVLFINNLKVEAKTYDMCLYQHPDYHNCTLFLEREEGEEFAMNKKLITAHRFDKAESIFEKFNDMSIMVGTCAKNYNVNKNNPVVGAPDNVKQVDVETIVPDLTHNKKFYKEFSESANKNKHCPTLYLGKTVYLCKLRNPSPETTHWPPDKLCFSSYINKKESEKLNRKQLKLKKESFGIEKDELKEETDSEIEKEKAEHKIDPEKMQKLVDNGEISQIKIGNKIFSCRQLIGDELYKHIKVIFTLIRIAAPILLIIFGMLDFTKAVTQGADTLTKSTKTFTKRLIICVIIFLVPTIIDFIMNVTGISDGICGL